MSFDAEDYLSTHLPGGHRSGTEYTTNCPGCGKAGKFYVNVVTKKFICFACEPDVRGNGAIDLICLVEGVSRREAQRRLLHHDRKARESSEVPLEGMLAALRAPAEPAALVHVPLPDEYAPCFDGEEWRWPRYLTERGVTREAAQRFRMGYVRGARCESECEKTARCKRCRYRGRVILPFECPNGSAFVGRDTTGKSKLKYLSPKKEEGYEARRLVYGWPPAGESWEGAEVFVVEGPLDVVRMWQHGLPALSLLGKAPGAEKIDMMARLGASGFIVMLDPEVDAEATLTAERLSSVAERVWVAKLPDGVDPGKSEVAQVREAYLAAEPFTGRRSRDLAALLSRIRIR